MNDADYEARRARREREREAGLAFTQTLRERLEAERIPIEALIEKGEPERPRELGAQGRQFAYSAPPSDDGGAA